MPGNYLVPPKLEPGKKTRRKRDPDTFVGGPDFYTRNKYYAWLKHRSQANYRSESYSLTWEEWQTLWKDELWDQRGQKGHNLCLAQINPKLGWHMNNVAVMTRKEQLTRSIQARTKKNV